MTTKGAVAYSIVGAAEAVDVSPDTIRREINAGRLRAKRLGRPDKNGHASGAYRITAKALDAWVEGLPDA